MTSPSETLFDDLQCLRELAEECYQTRVQAHGAPREQFTKLLLERGKAALSALQRQREQPVGEVAELVKECRRLAGLVEHDRDDLTARRLREAASALESFYAQVADLYERWPMGLEEIEESIAGHKRLIAAASQRAEAAEKALVKKESDCQYHMDCITNLASMLGLLGETSDTIVCSAIQQLADSEAKREAAEKDAKLLREFYEAWNICNNTRGKYSCVAEHDSRCTNQFMKTGKCVCGAAELARAEAAIEAASKGDKL